MCIRDSDNTDAAAIPSHEGMVRSRLTNEWVDPSVASTKMCIRDRLHSYPVLYFTFLRSVHFPETSHKQAVRLRATQPLSLIHI